MHSEVFLGALYVTAGTQQGSWRYVFDVKMHRSSSPAITCRSAARTPTASLSRPYSVNAPILAHRRSVCSILVSPAHGAGSLRTRPNAIAGSVRPSLRPCLRDQARRWGYQATQSADAGLGFRIFDSRLWMATDKIFLGIVYLGMLGLITDRFFRYMIVRFAYQYRPIE